MDLGLAGRVAIVTAASKGLGRAVAEELTREGARIATWARTPSTPEETAAQIQKATGRDVFHRTLDVTDSKAVTDFVASVETHFGCLDICVTNSGGPPSNLFKNTPPEAWRYALDQLLMSTFILQGKLCRRCSRTSEDF
jgi:3-oxoacyl-[acyl-carrier protein] reductase